MRFSSHWPLTRMRVAAAAAALAALLEHLAARQPAAVAHLAAHHGARRADDPLELLVADVGSRAPRIDPALVQALVLPEVPDARERALVEQRVGDRPGRVVGAQAHEDRRPVELVGEDVGPQPPQVGVVAQAAVADQLEDRAPELHHRVDRGLEHQPRGAGAPPHVETGARRSASGPTTQDAPAPTSAGGSDVRPLSQRRKRCLPWVSIERMRASASFSGQPSSAWRRCGVSTFSSGLSTSTGRSRPAIDRIVSPSGTDRS